MSQLFKRFRRDIIGLLWLSTGIFTAAALYSYSPGDPSFNSVGKSLQVTNYCGYFGSFLADLLYQFFGLSSWILVIGSVWRSSLSLRGIDPRPASLRWLWFTLLLFTGSSLLSLYWPQTRLFQNQIAVGGLSGMIISKALVGAFNSIGVQIILWTVSLALIVFYTEKSVRELISRPKQIITDIYEFFAERIRLGQFFRAIGQFFSGLNSQMVALLQGAGQKLAVESNYNTPEPSPTKQTSFLPVIEEAEEDVEEAYFEEEDAEEEDFEEEEEARPVAKRRVQMKKKVQRRIEKWELPKISMLEDPPLSRKKITPAEIEEKAEILINKLQQFGVNGEVVDAKPGPAVTMFEFKPNADVKISKITDLADDLSLALSAESVRIIAPIPGRDVVGIETSNASRETVYLKEMLASNEFWEENIYLPLTLGCEADGTQKIVDLRRMPHLLVAGTTGSGKSVFVVSLLTALLFRHSPKTLRMILIDPKQVDLAAFNKIPHLLMPPIREPKKSVGALRWAIKEMEKRYRSMSKFGARDLEGFNKIIKELSTEEITEHEAANEDVDGRPPQNSYYFSEQPYIVIVCEEFGDLMAVDKANVEQGVVRLAQMARACGIHLILAMQSPRKDVVTGLIKTNIPGRVSFKVNSKMDSRIILDESGGERLLSRGDMLFVSPGTSKPERHHGPWLTDKEIEKVASFWKNQAEPEFDPLAMKALEGMENPDDPMSAESFSEDEYDEKYDEILAFVSTVKEVSASLLQRRFRLGYPRAARLIEIFEAEGVVGPANGSKPRQVLVNELR